METQIQTSTPVAESASSSFPTAIVTAIFDAQSGNTKGKNVQIKWLTTRSGGTSNLVSFFLGSMATQNVQKRTALQFMDVDVIAQLKLDVGVNLNEALKAAGQPPVRLSISEISDEQYQTAKAVSANRVIGYQQKVNPSTDEVMGYKNAPIWRKTFVDTVDGTDEYLESDGSVVAISADDITV
jgi:hypothetical protein